MGKMYRGLNKNVFQRSAPSIPTRYRITVIPKQEKKGFSSQAKRFPSPASLSENPGPASYNCVSSAELDSPSFSKKGTTGFVVSKPARKPQSGIPGPDTYNLQSSLTKTCDFNAGFSRVFRAPLAAQSSGPKNVTPAPNQYHVESVSSERFSSVGGTSAFLSRTSRHVFSLNRDQVPSPGHYDVRRSVAQHGSNAVMSPFKSRTRRIAPPADQRTPGPGAYNPHQAPVKRSVPPRGSSQALSAPPLAVPKDPPLPGPGQYDVGGRDRASKHPKPTAAFASRTERILQNKRADGLPGPGFYDPQVLSKASFFYNDSRVWVPV